ncbi:MAG: flavodoxin domain-containing protein [Candidatus Thorarchaeota archaeon]
MKRVLILYDTQFGNTRKLALEIASGIQENEGISTKVANGDGLDTEDLSKYDAVLFGGPTRAFRATGGALTSIKKAAKLGLDGKVVACFGTYLMGKQSRGVKSMDKLLKKLAPGANHIRPGFSAKVEGVRGPIEARAIDDTKKFAKSVVEEIFHQTAQTVQVSSS